jgi:hypothetical protein
MKDILRSARTIDRVLATSLFLAVVLTTVRATNALQQQMIAPKVEKSVNRMIQEQTTITRTCPAGYEAHFVFVHEGFDTPMASLTTSGNFTYGELSTGPEVYAVCFKNGFMDEIKKNPDLKTTPPPPPRPV